MSGTVGVIDHFNAMIRRIVEQDRACERSHLYSQEGPQIGYCVRCGVHASAVNNPAGNNPNQKGQTNGTPQEDQHGSQDNQADPQASRSR